MSDVVRTSTYVLVPHVPHVYQFQQGKSAYRCEAFCLAALSAFAYPYRHGWDGLGETPVVVSGLDDLAERIYVRYVGPDTPQDTNGMNKQNAINWFGANHIGYHDLQPLIDAGDLEALREELAAMNKIGIPVMLGIDDESHLKTPDGKKMHSWNDAGLHHTIIRLGMDINQPITLILDPACPCPPFAFPTPVLWSDLSECHINTALGIMPPGVAAPPADFRFHHSDQDFVWPVPSPKFDAGKAEGTVSAMSQAMSQAIAALQASQSAMDNLVHDLASLKEEV